MLSFSQTIFLCLQLCPLGIRLMTTEPSHLYTSQHLLKHHLFIHGSLLGALGNIKNQKECRQRIILAHGPSQNMKHPIHGPNHTWTTLQYGFPHHMDHPHPMDLPSHGSSHHMYLPTTWTTLL